MYLWVPWYIIFSSLENTLVFLWIEIVVKETNSIDLVTIPNEWGRLFNCFICYLIVVFNCLYSQKWYKNSIIWKLSSFFQPRWVLHISRIFKKVRVRFIWLRLQNIIFICYIHIWFFYHILFYFNREKDLTSSRWCVSFSSFSFQLHWLIPSQTDVDLHQKTSPVNKMNTVAMVVMTWMDAQCQILAIRLET